MVRIGLILALISSSPVISFAQEQEKVSIQNLTILAESIEVDDNLRLGSSFDYTKERYGVFESQRHLSRIWRTLFNVRWKFYREKEAAVPPAPRFDFEQYSILWYALKGSGASFVDAVDVKETPNEVTVTFYVVHSDSGSNRLNLWKIPRIKDKKFIFVEKHINEKNLP